MQTLQDSSQLEVLQLGQQIMYTEFSFQTAMEQTEPRFGRVVVTSRSLPSRAFLGATITATAASFGTEGQM
jgi:hypothetical protein